MIPPPPSKISIPDVAKYVSTRWSIPITKTTCFNWIKIGRTDNNSGAIVKLKSVASTLPHRHIRGRTPRRHTTTKWVEDFVGATTNWNNK